jgi:hypothetical protein
VKRIAWTEQARADVRSLESPTGRKKGTQFRLTRFAPFCSASCAIASDRVDDKPLTSLDERLRAGGAYTKPNRLICRVVSVTG